MNRENISYILLLLALTLAGCRPELPVERYALFEFRPRHIVAGDSVLILLHNPLACPLRICVQSDIHAVDDELKADTKGTVVLAAHRKDTIVLPLPGAITLPEKPFRYTAMPGDPAVSKPDTSLRYSFPFPKGTTSLVQQAYHGSFSHNTPANKNGIDFKFDVGDTVCAALDGVVIGKIDGYTVGGGSQEYKPFANSLMIYHRDGTISMYLHLLPQSTMVEVGDTVQRLQPVALVGETGMTSSPHLHFATVVPVDDYGGVEGVPVQFELIDGESIKKGMKVGH